MIIADPDSSPLTLGSGSVIRHWRWPPAATSAVCHPVFRTGSGPQGSAPRVPGQALRHWKANQAPLGSQTPVSESSLTLPPSDITLPAPRAKSLGTDTCRSAVDYLAFCAESDGRPLDLRHQFGWPQALDALPPSLIRRSGMSRGIQGRHQPLTTFVSSPDSA